MVSAKRPKREQLPIPPKLEEKIEKIMRSAFGIGIVLTPTYTTPGLRDPEAIKNAWRVSLVIAFTRSMVELFAYYAACCVGDRYPETYDFRNEWAARSNYKEENIQILGRAIVAKFVMDLIVNAEEGRTLELMRSTGFVFGSIVEQAETIRKIFTQCLNVLN